MSARPSAAKKNVAILEVHPIGNYAVRLVFDDLHSTGIYSWEYLHTLGEHHAQYWQDYLDDLAGKGLSQMRQSRGHRLLSPVIAVGLTRCGHCSAPRYGSRIGANGPYLCCCSLKLSA